MFWGLTYRELHYMAAGHRQRQREFVLPFRELFGLLHNIHVEAKDRAPAAKLWPLPGDPVPDAPKPITPEETQSLIERIRARDATQTA